MTPASVTTIAPSVVHDTSIGYNDRTIGHPMTPASVIHDTGIGHNDRTVGRP
jgi:hypothetical protein